MLISAFAPLSRPRLEFLVEKSAYGQYHCKSLFAGDEDLRKLRPHVGLFYDRGPKRGYNFSSPHMMLLLIAETAVLAFQGTLRP